MSAVDIAGLEDAGAMSGSAGAMSSGEGTCNGS